MTRAYSDITVPAAMWRGVVHGSHTLGTASEHLRAVLFVTYTSLCNPLSNPVQWSQFPSNKMETHLKLGVRTQGGQLSAL